MQQTQGIFTGDGGPVTTIALVGDPAPEGTFTAFSEPRISDGTVAFRAGFRQMPTDLRVGIFTVSGGMVTMIVPQGGNNPIGPIGDPAIHGGKVVFRGSTDDGLPGIYASSGGAIDQIVKTGDPAPIGTFSFVAFPSVSGDPIAFHGADDGGDGVFMYSNGTLTPIVRTTDAAPSGVFDAIWESVIGGHSVAFTADYGGAGEQGIFVGSGGLVTTVIKTGDALFGSTIERFANLVGDPPEFAFDADGSGNLAFFYALTDGRVGIAIARPVPEPGTIALVGAGIALGFMSRPRRMSASLSP